MACDLPLLTPDLLRDLRERGTLSAQRAVVPEGPDGAPEPLCAWYSVRALPEVEARLARRDLRVRSLVEALEHGDFAREDKIKVSRRAAFTERNVTTGWNRHGYYQAVTEMTLDDALKVMMVHSANDAAIAIADALGGSTADFADMMNDAADRLGMSSSYFVNPNGLPADAQVVSVADMAKLAQAIVTNYYLPEKRMGAAVQVLTSGEADPEQVEAALLDVVRQGMLEVPGLVADPAPYVWFEGFGEAGLSFTLNYQVADFAAQFPVRHALRKRILRRLREDGVELPAPRRSVILSGGGVRPQ